MSILYRYVADKERVMYVGLVYEDSLNALERRMYEHSIDPAFMDRPWRVDIIDNLTRTDAEYLEAHFINSCNPPLNRAKRGWGVLTIAAEIPKWKFYEPGKIDDRAREERPKWTYDCKRCHQKVVRYGSRFDPPGQYSFVCETHKTHIYCGGMLCSSCASVVAEHLMRAFDYAIDTYPSSMTKTEEAAPCV